MLLQDGEPAAVETKPTDARQNADNVKAATYFLGVDAVGISRCPDWTWYSHDATGDPIDPPHDQAISMIIDQGYETMEGASGDDHVVEDLAAAIGDPAQLDRSPEVDRQAERDAAFAADLAVPPHAWPPLLAMAAVIMPLATFCLISAAVAFPSIIISIPHS